MKRCRSRGLGVRAHAAVCAGAQAGPSGPGRPSALSPALLLGKVMIAVIPRTDRGRGRMSTGLSAAPPPRRHSVLPLGATTEFQVSARKSVTY